MFRQKITGKNLIKRLSLVTALVVVGLANVAFSEVLTITDELRFEMDQPKSIWTNNESNDNSQFRLDFKEDLIDIEIGENVGGYEPLGAFASAAPEFTKATRRQDFSSGDLVCLPPNIDQDGVCYECPTGYSYDLGVSTALGELSCSSDFPNQPIETNTSPSFDLDQCPAGFKPVGLFSDECYSCPDGYSLDGSTCEKVASAISEPVSCPSGARKAIDGSCISCEDYSGYSFNSLGTTCIRPKSLTTMKKVGSRTRTCITPNPLGGCLFYSGWKYSPKNYDVRSGDNLYSCPSGYTHNIFKSFNNTGICEKSYSDKSPHSVSGCPSNSVNILGSCLSCPSGSTFDGATSCLQEQNALFAPPDELLCGSGEFWDPFRPDSCFSCGAGEVRDVLTNTCKPVVPMVASAVQPGVCPATINVNGDELPTFPDFFASNPGCYTCPTDTVRTLSSVDSDEACFGMNYDASSGVEVGLQLDYGLGFRWGIGGGMVADGGSVDVTYDTDVNVDVVPLEGSNFRINTAQVESSINSSMTATTPGFTFFLSAHNEGYAKVTSTMKYLDFDESTGLPIPREDVTVLIDADTDGTNRDGTTREIGPYGYGEANEEFLKFAVTPLDGNLRLWIDQVDWSAALGQFNKSEGTKAIYNPLLIPPGYCPPPALALPGSVCNGIETSDMLAKFPKIASPPTGDFVGEHLFDITTSYEGSGTVISDSIRAGDRSSFKNLFANGSDPLDAFEVDRTAGTKDPDFFRFDFDLDGAFTMNSGIAMGLITRKFKPSLPPKKPSILYELSGDVMDMKAALILSLERNLTFVPNLEVTLTFSQPVVVDDEGDAVEFVTIPVGESLEFSHPGGDLSIATSYSIASNDFTNDTNLNLEPLISGKAIAVGWKLPFPTPTLPKELSAVKYSVEVAEQPLTVLHLNFHDPIFSGKQEATFSLSGFSDLSGGTSLSVAAPNSAPIASCQDVTLLADGTGIAKLNASLIDAGSSDPDGDLLDLSIDRASFACTDVGANTVTLSVTDTFGAVSSCEAKVTVESQPLSLQVANQTLEATSYEGADIQLPTSVTGGCLVTTRTVQPAEGFYPIGSHTFAVTIMDEAGNALTNDVDVIVQDTTPPVFDAITNTMVDEGQDTSVAQLGLVTVTDIADPFPVLTHTDSVMAGDTGIVSVIERRWLATDASGNTASASQYITVLDKTPPVITLLGDASIQLEAGSNYSDAGATASDNLDGNLTAQIQVSGLPELNPPAPGTYVIRYDVIDGGNNAAVQVTRQLVVADTIPPVITLLGAAAVTLEAGSDYVDLGATALDSAEGDVSGDIQTLGLPFNTRAVGTYLVQYTVSDSAGNLATALVEVTVVDTTAPEFESRENEVIYLSADQSTVEYTVIPLVATDIVDDNLAVACGPQVLTLNVGVNAVSCSVTDSSGNTATQTFEVTVIDGIPPTLTIPADVVLEFGSDTNIQSTGEAIASDAVDGVVGATYTDESLSGEGETVVVIQRNWLAIDSAGNEARGAQRIELVDTTAPVLVVPADVSLLVGDSTDPYAAGSATGSATAVDLFDPDAILSFTDTSTPGSVLVTEVITRVWRAVDSVGNVALGTQTITISEPDTQPVATIDAPVLTGTIPLVLDLQALVESGNGPFTYSWTVGDATYSGSAIQLNIETAGRYLVELSVSDIDGDVTLASVMVEATLVPIDDLLAQIDALRLDRQSVKEADQAAQAGYKLQIEALRANIRGERDAQKALREDSKQTVAGLREARKATTDPELRIELSDQIAAVYAGRQSAALAVLQNIQSVQRDISALRQQRQVARHGRVAAVLDINAAIAAIRLEIRQRQTGSTAERDLVDQEIFELQSQRREERAQHSQRKLEARDVLAALSDESRMNRLNLKIAQKAKSDEIRAVRALLRREKDAAIKASLKAEINLLKAESSDLRDSANAERASIKAEIALTKAGNKVANETHQATLAQLGDQIKALRQER